MSSMILKDNGAALISLLIGLITFVIVKIILMYRNRKNYPPGPTPLPLLGNILSFRNADHVHETVFKFKKDYGNVVTLYIGPEPVVFVIGTDAVLAMLKDKATAGRPKFAINDILLPPGSIDVAFASFSRGWDVLRRVTHAAVRKYVVDDALPDAVQQVTDEMIDTFMKVGWTFDPKEPLRMLMISLLANSAFGRRYVFHDKDFLELKQMFEMQEEGSKAFAMLNFLPFAKYIWRKQYRLLVDSADVLIANGINQYHEHVKTFDEQHIKDFMDAVISAKKEAEIEDPENAKYLSPQNVANCVNDLFTAGTDTTRHSLSWILMFLAEHQNYQAKVRKEVDENISKDVMPTLELRQRLNLLQAFIAEVLRVRPVAPIGLPHLTMTDTVVDGHKVAEGTMIVGLIQAACNDPAVWQDPETFRPERFLDTNGIFVSRPNSAYIPFSTGRRSCLGERLAVANMFLVTTRILQRTSGYRIVFAGEEKPDMNGDSYVTGFYVPGPFKIMFQKV